MEEYPIYDRILGSGSNAEEKIVALAVGVKGGEGTRVDMTLALASSVSILLAAHVHKINQQLPSQDREEAAPIQANAIFVASTDDARLCLVFELEGGGILPLACDADALSGLAAELTLLTSRKGQRPN